MKRIIFITISILTFSCKHEKVSIVYPSLINNVKLQQQYRAALWCSYTHYLTCDFMNRNKFSIDSIPLGIKRLLKVKRTLDSVSEFKENTLFKFSLSFEGGSGDSILVNASHYNAYPLAAVYVSNRDFAIDSVVDYRNIIRSASAYRVAKIHGVDTIVLVDNGKWMSPLNKDDSCKIHCLVYIGNYLNSDLHALCVGKGIVE